MTGNKPKKHIMEGTTSKIFTRRMSSPPSYWDTSSHNETATQGSETDDKSNVSRAYSANAADSKTFGGGKGWEGWESGDSHRSYEGSNLEDSEGTSSAEMTDGLVSVCTSFSKGTNKDQGGSKSATSYDPSQVNYSSSNTTPSEGSPVEIGTRKHYSESARFDKVIRPNLSIAPIFSMKRRDSFVGRDNFMKEMDKDDKAVSSRRSSIASVLGLDQSRNRSFSRKSSKASMASSILAVENSVRSGLRNAVTKDGSDNDLKKDCKVKKLSPFAKRCLIICTVTLILCAIGIVLIAVFLPETTAGTSVRNTSSSLLRKTHHILTGESDTQEGETIFLEGEN